MEMKVPSFGKQVASIGRIVIYNNAEPAIIQHVNEDGSVRLFVFGEKNYHIEVNVVEGTGEGQWSFPVIVQPKIDAVVEDKPKTEAKTEAKKDVKGSKHADSK